jgi:hypothetical protein
LADTGELAAGIAMIDAAIVDLRTLTGPDALQAGIFLQNLVAYRIDLGELALADSNAAEALRIISAQVEPESVPFAGTLAARALARLALRDAGAALEEFNRAIPSSNGCWARSAKRHCWRVPAERLRSPIWVGWTKLNTEIEAVSEVHQHARLLRAIGCTRCPGAWNHCANARRFPSRRCRRNHRLRR